MLSSTEKSYITLVGIYTNEKSDFVELMISSGILSDYRVEQI
jgi:hypothetical protein